LAPEFNFRFNPVLTLHLSPPWALTTCNLNPNTSLSGLNLIPGSVFRLTSTHSPTLTPSLVPVPTQTQPLPKTAHSRRSHSFPSPYHQGCHSPT
jgi:hypothetical protein